MSLPDPQPQSQSLAFPEGAANIPKATLDALGAAIRQSWSQETAYERQLAPGEPWLGQSDITALIVNMFFGGEIIETKFERYRLNPRMDKHWHNRFRGADIAIDLCSKEMPEFPHQASLFGARRVDPDELMQNLDRRRRFDILMKSVVEKL